MHSGSTRSIPASGTASGGRRYSSAPVSKRVSFCLAESIRSPGRATQQTPTAMTLWDKRKENNYGFGKFDYLGAICRGDRANDEAHLGQDGREDSYRGDREHGNWCCDRGRGEDQLSCGSGRRDRAGTAVRVVCAHRRSTGQRAELCA